VLGRQDIGGVLDSRRTTNGMLRAIAARDEIPVVFAARLAQ
jgi:hypothetical protein